MGCCGISLPSVQDISNAISGAGNSAIDAGSQIIGSGGNLITGGTGIAQNLIGGGGGGGVGASASTNTSISTSPTVNVTAPDVVVNMDMNELADVIRASSGNTKYAVDTLSGAIKSAIVLSISAAIAIAIYKGKGTKK